MQQTKNPYNYKPAFLFFIIQSDVSILSIEVAHETQQKYCIIKKVHVHVRFGESQFGFYSPLCIRVIVSNLL